MTGAATAETPSLPWPTHSPSTMMDSVVEGARETASSLKRLARRASVSSMSPGRDLREDSHRSREAYMLRLVTLYRTSSSDTLTGGRWQHSAVSSLNVLPFRPFARPILTHLKSPL